MAKVYRAVFKSKDGQTFSCHVELQNGVWMMQTSDGFQPLTQTFQDDAGGTLKLDSYREVTPEPDSRLHVESGGSWQDHKNRFAETELANQRKSREQARTELQEIPLNGKSAARAEAAHRERQEFAKTMRPNGKGVVLNRKD
jgi:hypothetical protein